jgi:hypothetical protein
MRVTIVFLSVAFVAWAYAFQPKPPPAYPAMSKATSQPAVMVAESGYTCRPQ